jgi:hypothetical protein
VLQRHTVSVSTMDGQITEFIEIIEFPGAVFHTEQPAAKSSLFGRPQRQGACRIGNNRPWSSRSGHDLPPVEPASLSHP